MLRSGTVIWAVPGSAHASRRVSRPNLLWLMAFVIAVFAISNDQSLRVSSVNAAAIVATAMAGSFVLHGLLRGRLSFRRHRVQAPFLTLFLWAAVSLAIAHLFPSKAIPSEAYGYSWTTALNSPDWRGLSFLVRLAIALVAVEVIIQRLDSLDLYFRITNAILVIYSLFTLMTFAQVVLLFGFGIQVGSIVVPEGEQIARIGGYVGEPQTLAGLLLFGLFPVLASILHHESRIWLSKRSLYVIGGIAVVNLMCTYSVSFIMALVAVLLIRLRRHLTRRAVFIILLVAAIGAILALTSYGDWIVNKLLNESFSMNTRTITWVAGLQMFQQNPVTGVGIGQSPLVVSKYLHLFGRGIDYTRLMAYEELRTTPMNTYVEWLAETGLIGLAILAWLGYSLCRLGRRVASSPQKRFIVDAYGQSLLAFAIAFNSYPGGLYIGYVGLTLAMYISGLTLLDKSRPAAVRR